MATLVGKRSVRRAAGVDVDDREISIRWISRLRPRRRIASRRPFGDHAGAILGRAAIISETELRRALPLRQHALGAPISLHEHDARRRLPSPSTRMNANRRPSGDQPMGLFTRSRSRFEAPPRKGTRHSSNAWPFSRLT